MSDAVYQLKVGLRDSKPPIWRRLRVCGGTTLDRLHLIIQAAMGWEGGHLYDFTIGGLSYTEARLAARDGDEAAHRATLTSLYLRTGARFVYTYDFGDDWKHLVAVEKLLDPDPDVRYPLCVAGRRACPPEDIGGVWGYTAFLAALKDPTHPEHDDTLDWLEEDFDPAVIDLDAINRELRKMRWR